MANTSITLDELYNKIKDASKDISERLFYAPNTIVGRSVGASITITLSNNIDKFHCLIVKGKQDSTNNNVSISHTIPTKFLLEDQEFWISDWYSSDSVDGFSIRRATDSTNQLVLTARGNATPEAKIDEVIGVRFGTKILYYKILDLFLSLFSKREVMRIG